MAAEPRGLKGLQAVAAELRRRLESLARHGSDEATIALRSARLILQREPAVQKLYREAILTKWIKAARTIVNKANIKGPGPIGLILPPAPPATFAGALEPPLGPIVIFPALEFAVRDLLAKEILTADDFHNLDVEAQQTAFTVARAQSLHTINRVRDLIAEDIAQGGTLKQFRENLAGQLDDVLSPAQIETIYRTQIGNAQAAGQQAVMEHPLVRDEFPYLLWTAIHDSRTRETHLEMERWGQNGTAVYRADDPMWNTLWPPAEWNCRCHVIPLSLEDAARHGSREAQTWLRTGESPITIIWAKTPYPITPPIGWPTHGRVGAVL